MTAVEAARLENPSSGASRKMRRPIVCTIRQPPSDVPYCQREAVGEHRPKRYGERLQAAPATRSAPTTPIACASFAPG